ncbi:MAG: ABC transporter substrate-binding protein [Chloroflexota bacterium]|nr:ABC transporter substrate-binding protein [Chloroflexota bacterium]
MNEDGRRVHPSPLDPRAASRSATSPHGPALTRRQLLRRGFALGLSAPALSALLAACGGANPTPTGAPTGTTAGAASTATATPAAGGATPAGTPGAGGGAQATGGAIPQPTAPAGRRGGEIIIGTLGEAQNINPFLGNETEGIWRIRMMYGQLVRLDPVSFVPRPGLAKSWTIDGNTFTFTLQDNAKFSDGSDLTAEDVAFTMRGILAKATASPNRSRLLSIQGAREYNEGTAQDVAGIKVVDPKTLAVTLAQPDSSLLVNMRFVYPVPRRALEGKDLTKDPFFQRPVGAGPFKFVSWQVGGDFVAERNPHYYEQGLPYLDKFTHRVIPDSQSLVNALLSGDIDASNYPSPAGADRLRANQNLNVIVPPFTAPDGWEFNFKNPYLARREVRMAIAMSLDMDQFARDSLYGLGKKGVGPIAPGNAFYDKGLQPIPYDPDRAKALIRQAGPPPGEIAFMVNKGNVLREDFLTYTQAQLEQLGIRVRAEVIEFATLIDRRTKGEFEVNGVIGGALVDPNDLALSFATGASANYNGYSNPRLDDLFVQARRELDAEKARPIYNQIQAILMEDLPYFFAWYRPFLHVAKKRFTGYVDSADTGGLFYELQNWSVAQ